MTAHDVRHLRVCGHCGRLGDKREMVDGIFHGQCFIDLHGLPALLRLPAEQLDNLTLGDIGVEAMKAILDKRNVHVDGFLDVIEKART